MNYENYDGSSGETMGRPQRQQPKGRSCPGAIALCFVFLFCFLALLEPCIHWLIDLFRTPEEKAEKAAKNDMSKKRS